nr:M28 family peptidase [Prolixibacteraceae bacterium]
MLERYIIGLILFIGFSPAGFGQVDPVQKIVERVSGDSIFYHIGRLQQMNRLAPANDRTCTQYLLETIRRYGVDSLYLQEFNADYRGTFSMGLPNIVAIRKGSLYPDSVFVLGAHYDAVNWNSDEGYTQGPCPGADDNASGTSGILEMMRLTGDWDFQKTVMFVLFGGEEFGLLGSEYFVSVETRNGTNIYAMLNFDMISHDLYEGAHCVMIINDRISRNLARTFIATLERYTPDLEYMEQET